MGEEQTKTAEEKAALKEEHKATIINKIISCATEIMKIAFSKGEGNTVWYKKGLYYILAGVLGIVVYLFTYHGPAIIDYVTMLISNLF